jgi:hypothetical protein
MPIRRAEELRVKALVLKALGVLVGPALREDLSSKLYDLRETGGTDVLIMTQPRLRSVVLIQEDAGSTSSAIQAES